MGLLNPRRLNPQGDQVLFGNTPVIRAIGDGHSKFTTLHLDSPKSYLFPAFLPLYIPRSSTTFYLHHDPRVLS